MDFENKKEISKPHLKVIDSVFSKDIPKENIKNTNKSNKNLVLDTILSCVDEELLYKNRHIEDKELSDTTVTPVSVIESKLSNYKSPELSIYTYFNERKNMKDDTQMENKVQNEKNLLFLTDNLSNKRSNALNKTNIKKNAESIELSNSIDKDNYNIENKIGSEKSANDILKNVDKLLLSPNFSLSSDMANLRDELISEKGEKDIKDDSVNIIDDELNEDLLSEDKDKLEKEKNEDGATEKAIKYTHINDRKEQYANLSNTDLKTNYSKYQDIIDEDIETRSIKGLANILLKTRKIKSEKTLAQIENINNKLDEENQDTDDDDDENREGEDD